MTHLIHWLPVVLGGGVAWVCQALVVPRLPEPLDEAEGDGQWHKPPYAGLATPGLQVLSALLGLAGGLVAAGRPGWEQPVLTGLSGVPACLAVVDARTTYLPRRLTHLGWLLAAVGAVATLVLAPAPTALVTRWFVCCSAVVGFFWLVWRITGALGFGDVRLAPLVALGPATLSGAGVLRFVLLGTFIGAVLGLATSMWRKRHPHPLGTVFAYGPALWLGSWLAVLNS